MKFYSIFDDEKYIGIINTTIYNNEYLLTIMNEYGTIILHNFNKRKFKDKIDLLLENMIYFRNHLLWNFDNGYRKTIDLNTDNSLLSGNITLLHNQVSKIIVRDCFNCIVKEIKDSVINKLHIIKL